MEYAPQKRVTNNSNLYQAREWRAQKEEVTKEKGPEDAEDKFIECVIYHRMWNSKACWKMVGDVTAGLKIIKTKGEFFASLKDNIRIRWKGLDWMECETW